MKHVYFALILLLLLLVCPDPGMAHRVNIFAYVDGDAVQVECSFSKSQRVRNGKLRMTDAQTGATLAEAVTDEQGAYRYKPEADFLQSGHGLTIQLNAGEGHQNSWTLAPEELQALDASERQPVSATEATGAKPVEQPHQKESVMSSPALEQRMEALLKAELAPLRQMLGQVLAAQHDDSPRARDIIGGIGWIIGLLGMATYVRYKKG